MLYSRDYLDGKKFSPSDCLDDVDLGFWWSLELRAKYRPDPNGNQFTSIFYLQHAKILISIDITADEEFVALYLRLNPTDEVEVKATYSFSILDQNGQRVYTISMSSVFMSSFQIFNLFFFLQTLITSFCTVIA